MSVRTGELEAQTRLRAGDMGKTKYSDFEIKTAVDGAVMVLCDACINGLSDLLVRTAVVALHEGSGLLPPDFLAVEEVCGRRLYRAVCERFAPGWGEYAIRGERIYARGVSLEMTYHARPAERDGVIDLPRQAVFGLSGIAAALLLAEPEAAMERARDLALTLKRRDKGFIADPQMWGA